MTTPGSGQRRSKGRTSTAQNEQMQQILRDLTTAAQMMAVAGQESRAVADSMMRSQDGLDYILGGLAGGGDPAWFGGAPTPRRKKKQPTQGDAPRAKDNQSDRPVHAQPAKARPPQQLHPRNLGLQAYQGAGSLQGGSHIGHMRTFARQRMGEYIHQRHGAASGSSFIPAERDETGNITSYHKYSNTGRFQGTVGASEEGVAGDVASAASRARISGIGGALSGEGAMAGLRAVPYVGGAVMAAGALWEGANFVSNQRAANSQYQSIYGGSNVAGMAQRAHGVGFQVSSMLGGGLSMGAAGEAYKGVSALGYGGANRNQALGFIQSNYKTMGMDVKSSMELISIASKNASGNLMDLEKQLRAVSDQAKATGQNANVVREAFVQNYGASQQAGLGAQSSGMVAQSATNVTAGMGRQYSGINMTGMLSQTGMTIAAANTGMTYSQFVGASQNNPMLVAGAQQDIINRAFDAVIDSASKTAIQQIIQQHGGNKAVVDNPGVQQSIGAEILKQGLLNIPALTGVLSGYGIDVSSLNPVNVAGWAVAWAAGGVDIKKQTAAQVSQTQQRSISDLAQGKGMPAGMSQHGTDVLKGQAQQAQYKAKYGTSGIGNDPGLAFDTKSGMYDPVIAELQKRYGADLKLGVQTADGYREVTLAEAAAKYRDQLVNGTAVLVDTKRSGDAKGQTVGDVVGTEQGAKTTDTTTSKATVGKKDQKDLQQLGLETGGKGGNGGQVGVYIDMTPELKKYLNITTTGNPVVNAGAANNVPPKAPR